MMDVDVARDRRLGQAQGKARVRTLFSATPWGDRPHHKTKKPLMQSANASQPTELVALRILL